MSRQPDDIHRYIRLTETVMPLADDESLEDLSEILVTDMSPLLEDVGDMIFKLRSYCEPDGSQDYVKGVEEGLALAASMLESLLERHSGHSSK